MFGAVYKGIVKNIINNKEGRKIGMEIEHLQKYCTGNGSNVINSSNRMIVRERSAHTLTLHL